MAHTDTPPNKCGTLMLVDVVLMRVHGEKLSPAQLAEATPVRGRVVIITEPWRELWCPDVARVRTTFAKLYDPDVEGQTFRERLPSLREARVNALEGNQFVVVGVERSGDNLRPVDEPQAWWCRVAT